MLYHPNWGTMLEPGSLLTSIEDLRVSWSLSKIEVKVQEVTKD